MFNIVTILEPRNKENENSNIKRERIKDIKFAKMLITICLYLGD